MDGTNEVAFNTHDWGWYGRSAYGGTRLSQKRSAGFDNNEQIFLVRARKSLGGGSGMNQDKSRRERRDLVIQVGD